MIARQPLDDHQTTAVRPPDDRTTIVIIFDLQIHIGILMRFLLQCILCILLHTTNSFNNGLATLHVLSPPLLLATLSANVTVRDASPYGPIFSNSEVFADTTTGNYLSASRTFIPSPESSFYLRLCSLNISYYLGSDQNCTSRIPLSGQCQCLQHNLKKKCTFWEPSLSPNTIPSTAQYLGKSDINSYHNVSEWNYYYPPFASTINVWTVQVKDTNQSFVTRTVGARVQTDYMNVIIGKPKESVFNIPKECK